MAGGFPRFHQRNVLTGFRVREVMRRKVVRLASTASLLEGMRLMIKHRVSAVLVDSGTPPAPVGVLSKTDLISAYYADLASETGAADIMSSPVWSCLADHSLEQALEAMREYRVSRLYVRERDGEPVIGVLAYPEVVGLLYRQCRHCPQSLLREKGENGDGEVIARLQVKDVMRREVTMVAASSSIEQLLELLTVPGTGELLLCSPENAVVGTVTVSDLVRAYLRRLHRTSAASLAMSAPVRSCGAGAMLETAIEEMILGDVSRLFVVGDDRRIVGKISLADAARSRSGSCQACLASRILPLPG